MLRWNGYCSLFLSIAFLGCVGAGTGLETGDTVETTDTTGQSTNFKMCLDAPRPTGLSTIGWSNLLTSVLNLGSPDHSAQDVVAVPGKSNAINGKFAYGPLSKDLEGEQIEVWMDDCSGAMKKLGQAKTNSDGRIEFSISDSKLPAFGAYAVQLRVMGDNTWTNAVFRVVPEGTQFVVFDIDATLTTDDLEVFVDVVADLFTPIGTGDYVPEARAGAADITNLRRITQGYQILYMTGRPYNLMTRSREWLANGGFAPGTIHTTSKTSEFLPGEAGVGDFKAANINKIKAKGVTFALAYGNATTDIYGYANGGIPPENTYILGKHGGKGGTVALGDDYLEHLPVAGAEPVAVQPFSY